MKLSWGSALKFLFEWVGLLCFSQESSCTSIGKIWGAFSWNCFVKATLAASELAFLFLPLGRPEHCIFLHIRFEPLMWVIILNCTAFCYSNWYNLFCGKYFILLKLKLLFCIGLFVRAKYCNVCRIHLFLRAMWMMTLLLQFRLKHICTSIGKYNLFAKGKLK